MTRTAISLPTDIARSYPALLSDGLLPQFRTGGDEDVRNALLLATNRAAAGFGATG